MSLTKAFKDAKGVTGNHWVVTKSINHYEQDLLEVEISLFYNSTEHAAGAEPMNTRRIFKMSNSDTAMATIETAIKADTEDKFFIDAT